MIVDDRASLSVLALLLSVSCRGGKPAESPATEPLSGTWESPVVRCGPEDSYAYIAKEFRCPDGTNPLNGDLRRGHQARLGSKEHPASGHIVDIYEVPCADGLATVYVDMYGCEEARDNLQQMVQQSEPSPRLAKALALYDQGDYAGAVGECTPILLGSTNAMESSLCEVLHISSFVLMKMTEQANARAAKVCANMPRGSELSDARARFVAQVILFLARSQELDVERASVVLADLCEACSIPPAAVVQLLE